jgi:hypothetical protein
MNKTRLLVVAAVLLGAIQLVPVARTNPPVEAEVAAPPAIKALLQRACNDCHSHETAWGWHTYIAPISWLVAHDVSEGREELNFSRWGKLEPRHQAKLPRKIQEEVAEKEMPPLLYRVAHPAARLSDADREVLVAWARSLPSEAGATAHTSGAQGK